MRTKRSIQINVCVSPAEMKRARARAKRETEGNVSALVRKMLFAESNTQGGAGISVQSISAEIGELAGMIAALPQHSEQCAILHGEQCNCGLLYPQASEGEGGAHSNTECYRCGSLLAKYRSDTGKALCTACFNAYEASDEIASEIDAESNTTQTIADEVQEVHCE